MKDKAQKRELFDSQAAQRDHWKQKNQYYYKELESFLSFLIPSDASVLEIGCGTGDLLARLNPPWGHGIDFSPAMIEVARRKYPPDRFENLAFSVDDIEDLKHRDTYDHIIMSDVLGDLTDVWAAFRNMRTICHPGSRVIITYFNPLWEPVLRLGERLGMKIPQDYQNWLSLNDIHNLLDLNGFEVIKKGQLLLLPKQVPFLSTFLNRYVAKIPLLCRLPLVVYLIARPVVPERTPDRRPSVSVIVPCRNEEGNIRPAVERIPEMGSHTEILFVDGLSTDGTVAAIEDAMEEFKGIKDIKLLHQVPPGTGHAGREGKMLKLGKGDAVRKGFAAASGDILMILDADLTVPPEDLPKFYLALTEGVGEFINGTRLIYPMEEQAMRFLNKLGNKFFSLAFTWLLDQRIRDTLCGTKVLFKKDYQKIANGRSFFGDFDPFGDFDLLFGAAKLNLKIVEVPIRYRRRTYGDIKIERFKHGLILLKMSGVAMRKLKLR